MKELVREAAARGYCHPKNSHKELDTDLLDAICEEVMNTLAPLHDDPNADGDNDPLEPFQTSVGKVIGG